MIFVGIDIGALAAKSVAIKDGEIISYQIMPTGASGKVTAEKVFDKLLSEASIKREDVLYIVATGYGRVSVPFANRQVTEITCHAKGAHFLLPKARVVIDIGGQDSKVIKLGPDGKVLDFVMNEKCAAGTGRFLEVMANALEVDLEELGPLSLKSTVRIDISSTCTVFAESEVVSLVATGTPKVDIIAGIHRAIAARVYAMVASRTQGEVLKKGEVVMTGGVAKNIGVVKALEEKIGVEIVTPDEPQIVGALGAALIAESSAKQKA